MRYLVRHLLLAFCPQIGIVENGAIELFIVAHRILEHADRARQRADLIAAIAERDGNSAITRRDCSCHLVISAIGFVTLRPMMATPMSASTTAMPARTVSNKAVWSMPSSICV